MNKLSWTTIATFVCVVVFVVLELQSPTALIIFLCGIVARDWFAGHWKRFKEARADTVGWMYHHTIQWAHELHSPLNPKKCRDCNPKTAPKSG